jgi:UMF1 family MFS transporter
MVLPETVAAAAPVSAGGRIDRGAWSWALFEWARNPWVLLGTIYVFTPYLSNFVIGDPVRGQSIIAGWHTTSGAIIAFTAPFLGAATDRMGRRKPLLGIAAGVLALAIISMWWALPDGGGLPLWAIGLAVVVSGVSFVYTEVVHNAMLTRATPPAMLSHVSGLGLALGSVASVLLLVFVLVTMALPGQIDLPFLPDAPMFGLDPAQHEPSRIVTLLCAAWLIVFSVPIFLYTPDLTTTGEPLGTALKNAVGNVFRTILKLRDYRNVALFLIARILYADGKTAILIFSGVYVSGTMDWNLLEMLAYGIILTIFAIAGGLGAGLLDHAVGVKRAVAIEIGVTILCLIAMVSMSPTSVFFLPVEPGVPAWDSPFFSTLPELAYLGFAILIAISITAAYASSRSLMARLAPKGMEGEVFGLYALAGSATAWLAPGLVAYFTSTTQSLRAGFASIVILLIVGFVLLLFVKPPARVDH